MAEEIKKNFIGFPEAISYTSTKKILEQMDKSICKININNIQGTGFFCKIPFPSLNNMMQVLITNNYIINEDILNNNGMIKIKINEEKKERIIDLKGRMKYTNKEYGVTIIEIKEKDKIKNNLELDNLMINDIIYNNFGNYINQYETIYIIQYPEGELSVSYGILNLLNTRKIYGLNYFCNTKTGSSGSPILNKNNKVIGVHMDKNMGTFLNYPIKDFIQKNFSNIFNNIYDNSILLLNEFNKKYHLNIQNMEIDELDLENKNIRNEGLKDLSKLEFKKLKKLYLNNNNISDIKDLEKLKFDKLELLSLDYNKISDIDALKNCNFGELKELSLKNNIVILYNSISNINILDKVNFPLLKILILKFNNIKDINVLEKVKFDKLEKLDLVNNKISDIKVLEKVNFKELKYLNLKNNNISDINVLEKVKFDKLEILSLEDNNITDINILEKVNFKQLKGLYLKNNNISDLEVLKRVKFKNLKTIDLGDDKNITDTLYDIKKRYSNKDIGKNNYIKFNYKTQVGMRKMNLGKIQSGENKTMININKGKITYIKNEDNNNINSTNYIPFSCIPQLERIDQSFFYSQIQE